MEELLKPCEENLEAMRSLLNGSVDQKQILQCMDVLQDTIVSLSKHCIDTLADCNDQFLAMSDQVNAVEGLMHIVKDSVGNKSQFHGNECNYTSNADILNVEQKGSTAISIPTGNFDISLGVLSDIGHKSESLGQGGPLIRKIKANTEEVQPWTKQADYFLMEKGDTTTSFSKIYNVPSPSYH